MTFEIGRIILLPYRVQLLNGSLNTYKQIKNKKTLKKNKKEKDERHCYTLNTANGMTKIE